MQGFLYLIGSGDTGDPVKVGTAKDVERRLVLIQTGSPKRLKILMTAPVDLGEARKAEAECHRALAGARLSGEWFAVDSATARQTIETVLADRLWTKPRKRPTYRPRPGSKVGVVFCVTPKLKADLEQISAEDGLPLKRWVERMIAERVALRAA